MEERKVSKDKRYEDRHKAERKAKCMVWGTSIERPLAEEINAFLKEYGFTKVQLIKAGYDALFEEAAEKTLKLAKLVDGYDDFFQDELDAFEKQKHQDRK